MQLILVFLRLILRWLKQLWRPLQGLYKWFTGTKWGKAIAWALAGSIGFYLKKAFTVLGISMVAYELGLPVLRDYVAGPLLGLPADWLAFLAMTKIDHATTVILSAVVVQLAAKIKIQRDRNAWQTPL